MIFLRGRTLSTALPIAFVVGSILNAINQGDAVLHLKGISWLRLALNYVVPFIVSSYGYVCAHRR